MWLWSIYKIIFLRYIELQGCAILPPAVGIGHWEEYSIQHYVIKYISDLRQVCGFLRFPLQIKLTAMIQWNIVESDVKHNKP